MWVGRSVAAFKLPQAVASGLDQADLVFSLSVTFFCLDANSALWRYLTERKLDANGVLWH